MIPRGPLPNIPFLTDAPDLTLVDTKKASVEKAIFGSDIWKRYLEAIFGRGIYIFIKLLTQFDFLDYFIKCVFYLSLSR